MTIEELERLIENSVASTGLKRVETVERNVSGRGVDVVGDVELIDLISSEGAARIEWKKLAVTADMLIAHKTEDVAALCWRCGATIHRDNLVSCAECSRPLCNRHRHYGGKETYVCGRHYVSLWLGKVLGL